MQQSFENPIKPVLDQCTYANYQEVYTEHLHLDVFVNFDSKIIEGVCTLKMKSLVDGLKTVFLDSWDLNIKGVKSNDKDLSFALEDPSNMAGEIGHSLKIELLEEISKDQVFEVHVTYETTHKSTALNFLSKEQTLQKEHPYLFSQSEMIHARAWIPCQDSPGVKATYSAKVKVVAPLKAVFGAIKTKEWTEDGFNYFEYDMLQKLPSYLISIFAGDVAFKKISERCGVYAEACQVDECAKEFEDTETYLKTAEEYIGMAYPLPEYNMVVLPPSFPYGGMENPVTTFLTPTLLVGDKSQTHVIYHEISHSWTGNLVTNSNWQDFWINEGFTVFLERKICLLCKGQDIFNLESRIGMEALSSVEENASDDNAARLVPEFGRINPDDILGKVQYEKGYAFLNYLESLLTPVVFQKFFQGHIKKYRDKNLQTRDFVDDFTAFVQKEFGQEEAEKILSKVDWLAWIKGVQLPVAPVFSSEKLDEVMKLADQYVALDGESSPEGSETIPQLYSLYFEAFLSYLLVHKGMNLKVVQKLDKDHDFTNKYSKEIRCTWYKIALTHKYEAAYPAIYEFLGSNGRIKYIRPLYALLDKIDHDKSVELFKQHEGFYHNLLVHMLKKILKQ